ncbi:MAG: aldehyde dehydrogenase family protein [Bryobacterales bacterium]|nr:aldehyde dehydrogenase family protein [Bryobacterales bacterium]
MDSGTSALWPLWIDGTEVFTSRQRAVRSPYDHQVAGTVCEADPISVQAAVDAAARAKSVMRALSRRERADILRAAAASLRTQRDQFAATITAESAKPIRESITEVDRGISTLEFSADEALRLVGEMVPMDAASTGKGYLGFTMREPVGVVAAITPFNFPLNLSLHKIAPALAAGNTVVHKPASATPLTALLLARVLHEAGLPPGALNTIPGPGSSVGDLLATHPDVQMITFTGSAEVGLALRERAGFKRFTLELGSNSAVVVLPDAPVDATVSRCVAGAFAHSGQVCISVQRVFVHQDVFEKFRASFAQQAASLRQGPPHDQSTQISCLISEGEAARVHGWIGEVASSLVVGGAAPVGAQLAPTVLSDVPAKAKLMRCEAFGPVACINPISSLDEGIAFVNDSDYGLQASIFTHHAPSAWKAAQETHTGAVLINETPQFRLDHMPYGGVKQSGTGREGPHFAMEEMTERKLIVWKL